MEQTNSQIGSTRSLLKSKARPVGVLMALESVVVEAAWVPQDTRSVKVVTIL